MDTGWQPLVALPLHDAIHAELTDLAGAGRPVRDYRVMRLGHGMTRVAFTFRNYSRNSVNPEEWPHRVVVFDQGDDHDEPVVVSRRDRRTLQA